MEVKKSPKADLENRKALSLIMGYVVALAILFVAFEWSSRDIEIAKAEGVSDIIAEEEIEITRPPENLPPPPPPPPVVAPDILTVVEDDIEVDDQDILSSDDDQNAAQVQTYVPPAVVEEEEESTNQIFTLVEDMPVFPGQDKDPNALLNYIQSHVRYPILAAENGIQGRVAITFVVNEQGKVVDAQVVRSVDPSLDKEALKVINALPTWKPGKQRGKPVKVKFTVPVTFKLK